MLLLSANNRASSFLSGVGREGGFQQRPALFHEPPLQNDYLDRYNRSMDGIDSLPVIFFFAMVYESSARSWALLDAGIQALKPHIPCPLKLGRNCLSCIELLQSPVDGACCHGTISNILQRWNSRLESALNVVLLLCPTKNAGNELLLSPRFLAPNRRVTRSTADTKSCLNSPTRSSASGSGEMLQLFVLSVQGYTH